MRRTRSSSTSSGSARKRSRSAATNAPPQKSQKKATPNQPATFNTIDCANPSLPVMSDLTKTKKESTNNYKKLSEEFNQRVQAPARSTVSWVDVKGNPIPTIEDILEGKKQPDLALLHLRDPDKFVAGGLKENAGEWDTVLEGHPDASTIKKWLHDGVDIKDFSQRFNGSYRDEDYDQEFPPPIKSFPNNPSCEENADFVSNEIMKRVESGAVRIWGQVEHGHPPHLVLPLQVEPTKPRLCVDARFVNLWMKDYPCRLERLDVVPHYVYKDSYMTKCDDKSGYDHIKLSKSSEEYFGFEWRGWWYVCTTLPFGCSVSQYVYQTVGLAATGYFRSLGIPCSLYVDDRLNGELMTRSGCWSTAPKDRSDDFRRQAATAAIFIVLSTLTKLGYTIGIEKSCFTPQQEMVYLGVTIDSRKQAFLMPQEKITKFKELREKILSQDTVDFQTLKKFQGKCIYKYSVAVPAAKLLVREMTSAIDDAKMGQISLSSNPELRKEIECWKFLDSLTGQIKWHRVKTLRLSMSTGASWRDLQCFTYFPSGQQSPIDISLSDEERALPVQTKVLLTLTKVLESVTTDIANCTVNIESNSKLIVGIIKGDSDISSPQNTEYIQKLFKLLYQRNIQLQLNDRPLHAFSNENSKLSKKAWKTIQNRFGGSSGHTFDLMALDSHNAALDCSDKPLPHFTPSASQYSNAALDRSGKRLLHSTPSTSPSFRGVDMFAQNLKDDQLPLSNPYVFPPFRLVAKVVRYLSSFGIPFTIVVPEFIPHPVWWPALMNMASKRICLGGRRNRTVIMVPSSSGFRLIPCPQKLWAFRVKGTDTI